MTKRDSWEFVYSVKEVADAAEERADYHDDRVTHWRGERSEAERELREKGVEFREHEVTGGKNVQAVIDPERQAHLNACASKIRNHESLRDEYRGYARALVRQYEREHDALLELTVRDILYFGLA